MEPPKTPSAFMDPRPPIPSTIPSKLTVNFVLPYSSELAAKEMMNLCKESNRSINLLRVFSFKHGSFSFSSSPSSSLQVISPLRFSKPTQTQLDSLSETSNHPLDSRRKPKVISHESAINLITNEKNPQRALEIFNMVAEQRGFVHNHATYSAILHKLAHAKKFEAVDGLLHQMTYETCKFHESILLSLMKHFAKSALYERVLEMFYSIQPIVRQKPSLNAISTCLNLLVEAKQEDLACKFLLHCKNSLRLEPNTCIFNILIKHHCKCGDLDSAFEVMKEMRQSHISYPNLITYSTLMGGLCRSGKLKEAIELFEEMVSKDHIVPDALTYNVLINGFSRGGKVDEARKIMEFMKSNGCNPNLVNYSAMMNGFCKEGRFREAKEVFNEMKSFGLGPDTIGYTTLIDSFCKASEIDEAMELLEEMKETKCRADIVTLNVVLKGLCSIGRYKEAVRMLEKVGHEGVRLNKSSYRIVLNFLCQNGELLKATEMLGLMLDKGFVPHHATSNEFLIRLCAAGMADDAVTALSGLVEMGFKPELDCWAVLIEVICRERKLLYAFELLDSLVIE